MECLKAMEEPIVDDEGVPMLAYKGRTKEVGGVWREEEKDADEQIIWWRHDDAGKGSVASFSSKGKPTIQITFSSLLTRVQDTMPMLI
jgi:hypothetical protein